MAHDCEFHSYRVFDLSLSCNFQLPGLVECARKAPMWTAELVKKSKFEIDSYDFIHEWKNETGEVTIASFRKGGEYILHFPGVADYRLDFNSQSIQVVPLPGTPTNTLAHLLLDQVIPRALCHTGKLVIHASGVLMPSGKAIAFVGLSGAGKSTLAAAFYRNGWKLIADDCLLLEVRDGLVHCIPAYPSLRLWGDSQNELLSDFEQVETKFSPVAHYTGKKQVILDQEDLLENTELAAIFILKEGELSVEPAKGSGPLMSMIESLFALDVASPSLQKQNFNLVSKFSALNIPFYKLSFRHDWKSLPDVLSAVGKAISDSIK